MFHYFLNCFTRLESARRKTWEPLSPQDIIKLDAGVTSFNFEFTEWANTIEPLVKAEGIKEKWFLGNSTHVVDLAFYLGGKPKKISTFTSGSLVWHPSSSVFAGAGITDKDILFSYSANWESAGRWTVEVLTKDNKLIFEPMIPAVAPRTCGASLFFLVCKIKSPSVFEVSTATCPF